MTSVGLLEMRQRCHSSSDRNAAHKREKTTTPKSTIARNLDFSPFSSRSSLEHFPVPVLICVVVYSLLHSSLSLIRWLHLLSCPVRANKLKLRPKRMLAAWPSIDYFISPWIAFIFENISHFILVRRHFGYWTANHPRITRNFAPLWWRHDSVAMTMAGWFVSLFHQPFNKFFFLLFHSLAVVNLGPRHFQFRQSNSIELSSWLSICYAFN